MDIAAYDLSHGWTLGANDPDLIGWLTTVAYLLVAVLCSVTGKIVMKDHITSRQWEAVFWFSLAIVLMALGLNKQLDLQTPFLGVSRHLAMAEGWYRERRVVQWTFLTCMATIVGCALVWIFWKLRHRWRDHWLAYVGVLLISVFVWLQASPIHLVKWLPWLNGLPVPGRHILELAGIGCIGVTGLITLRRARGSDR